MVGGERFREAGISKCPGDKLWQTVRNRNAFAIHGSGVPFPDVLSGNCCGLTGTLRTSKPPSTVPPPPSPSFPNFAKPTLRLRQPRRHNQTASWMGGCASSQLAKERLAIVFPMPKASPPKLTQTAPQPANSHRMKSNFILCISHIFAVCR